MDLLNVNDKLNKIKIKNKCSYVLKYYLIHSYDCELVHLFQTLGLLQMKYPQYGRFIDTIRNVFVNLESRHDGIKVKVDIIVNNINVKDYYDLYEDIIDTLHC